MNEYGAEHGEVHIQNRSLW